MAKNLYGKYEKMIVMKKIAVAVVVLFMCFIVYEYLTSGKK